MRRLLKFYLVAISLLMQPACSKQSDTAQEKRLEMDAHSAKIVHAAQWQLGKTVTYDRAYVRLDYPGGDLPIETGVCTDVVIRAMRKAWSKDLQQLVHEDMKTSFSKYPRIWGLKSADKNIDHRRVPNLQTYFSRQGWSLPITKKPEDYKPGDLVTCTVGGNRPHIMVVSDRVNDDGEPLCIHNIGGGVVENAALFVFPLTGHYRVK